MSWRIGETTYAADQLRAESAGAPGRYRVTIVGPEGPRVIEVAARREADGTLVLERDGRVTRALVSRAGDTRWVTVKNRGGETLKAVKVEARRGSASEAHAGGLEAPMPSKVTRVLVAVGDLVTKGQTLITLEAMKMEHALKSPRAGRVREVHAVAGELVQPGKALVVVEDEA
jgi:3-methylcrotonyl-CoA carboxylase alpha subunit